MNQDSKNALIGMLLIVGILIGWNYFMAPSPQQLEEQKRKQDSIAMAQRQADSTAQTQVTPTPLTTLPDSAKLQLLAGEFGDFSKLAVAQAEQTSTLENDVFKITFTNKGGRIKEVLLKNHKKIWEDENRQEHSELLKLFEDRKNRFEFIIPSNTSKGKISTEDLYFTPSVSGNTLVYRAEVDANLFIEQKYVIGGSYDIDYDVQFKGLPRVMKSDAKSVQLNVENYLDKLEKNVSYERAYSYQYYREINETPDYEHTTSADRTELKAPVQWVSQANQFFNTSIVSLNGGFKSGILEMQAMDEKNEDLLKMVARLEVPVESDAVGSKMKLYVGPNDYNLLKDYGWKLEDVVSYGGSILGTINRWIIRPIFDFLHGIVGNVAICILLLTLIVKALLYPLSYRQLKSQAKTTALKPEIEKMKAKFKDDQQRIQMEQMKLYQEFGVNPLGGCLPTLLQMPIWMALFRFFPASIDFRQQGFLWATDLTGFEEFIRLPFHIPLYGAHVSLFALLWGVSLIIFTWYTMKDVDMSGQPAGMKYIQYSTPAIFMVMFNSYAAGLSLYMLFSNILNIGQTIITKNYIIDHDKILETLHANKKKPKKQGYFGQLMEQARKQQEEMQRQQQNKKR